MTRGHLPCEWDRTGSGMSILTRAIASRAKTTAPALPDRRPAAAPIAPPDRRISARELVRKNNAFVEQYNAQASPFPWIATAESIPAKIQ